MKLLRSTDYRVMPWSNGGGTTTEVAIWPPDSSLDDCFGWRISMADVRASGPFSLFPGVDRHLVVTEGQGMVLHGMPDGPLEVAPLGGPASFPGEIAIDGQLRGGAIRDYNLMVRRGQFSGRLALSRTQGPSTAVAGDGWTVITVLLGRLSVDGGRAETGDSLILSPGEETVYAAIGKTEALLAISEITPCRPAT